MYSNNKDKEGYTHIKPSNQWMFLKCLLYKNRRPRLLPQPSPPWFGSSAPRRDNGVLKREPASAERPPSVNVQGPSYKGDSALSGSADPGPVLKGVPQQKKEIRHIAHGRTRGCRGKMCRKEGGICCPLCLFSLYHTELDATGQAFQPGD